MKPKGKFIIIETELIRSEQLSSPEKLLYLTLRTYRHNSPPVLCNPGHKTLMRSSGLSKATFLKALKLLVLKGLIKYKPGGGRKNTNKYMFPLENGTDEEKRRLVAYLKAKKTGKKSNHFKSRENGAKSNQLSLKKNGAKSNQLPDQKQVKNRTTLQPNSGQKTGAKSNHEQEVRLKKQQQKTDAAKLSSPNQKTNHIVKDLTQAIVKGLINKLKTLGIKSKKTRELIAEYGLSSVQDQLQWLGDRNITYPAGALIAALKENWPKPVLVKANEAPPESESKEYQRQYEKLKELSKQRSRLDMKRRKTGKIGKKLNPYNSGGLTPYFADQVPDEVCRSCPLSYNIHPLEHKTQGRLICMRRDVRAGLVGVMELSNGIPERGAQPAIP